MLILVLDGPVSADGYDWYLVVEFRRHVCTDVCGEKPLFGWVAHAAKDGEPWIAPGAIDCPSPTVDSIRWLSSVARLACFGDMTLTLDGTTGGCFASETPVAWKQTGCVLDPPDHVPSETFEASLAIYAGTGVRIPGAGFDVRVTGHFDDPAAETCAGPAPDFGLQPVPAELAVLSCRGDFVVTKVDVPS